MDAAGELADIGSAKQHHQRRTARCAYIFLPICRAARCNKRSARDNACGSPLRRARNPRRGSIYKTRSGIRVNSRSRSARGLSGDELPPVLSFLLDAVALPRTAVP